MQNRTKLKKKQQQHGSYYIKHLTTSSISYSNYCVSLQHTWVKNNKLWKRELGNNSINIEYSILCKSSKTSLECQRHVLQYLTFSLFVPHLKLNNTLITRWSVIITLTAPLLLIITASTLSFSYASIYTYYIVMMKTH